MPKPIQKINKNIDYFFDGSLGRFCMDLGRILGACSEPKRHPNDDDLLDVILDAWDFQGRHSRQKQIIWSNRKASHFLRLPKGERGRDN